MSVREPIHWRDFAEWWFGEGPVPCSGLWLLFWMLPAAASDAPSWLVVLATAPVLLSVLAFPIVCGVLWVLDRRGAEAQP